MKRNLLLLLLVSLFATRGFSDGVYLEFKVSTDKSGSGNMVTYTHNGDSRSELSFSVPQKQADMMPKTMVTLMLKDKPDLVYLLNTDKKTYTEMDISKKEDAKDYSQDDYDVTVIGKEKVNGYNAVHVKVKNKKSEMEQEMWMTTELKDFADFSKVKTKYTGKENLNKALAAKGAAGFPVRIQVTEKFGTATIDLVKAEKRDNPASMFSLDGFSKSAGGSASDPNVQQEMIQKLQKMSPEERQKYIEELKKQYGNQPK